MDANKLQVLNDIGYHLPDCCEHCEFSSFVRGELFGECLQFDYDHGKHTGRSRGVSIHRTGVCAFFTPCTGVRRETKDARLHGFVELRRN